MNVYRFSFDLYGWTGIDETVLRILKALDLSVVSLLTTLKNNEPLTVLVTIYCWGVNGRRDVKYRSYSPFRPNDVMDLFDLTMLDLIAVMNRYRDLPRFHDFLLRRLNSLKRLKYDLRRIIYETDYETDEDE
jgi:hypothetical protein